MKAKYSIGDHVKVSAGIVVPFLATVVSSSVAENIVTGRDEVNYVVKAHDDDFLYHAKEEWLTNNLL